MTTEPLNWQLVPRGRRLPTWARNATTVFFGMSVVNVGNYAVNLLLGRYLAPGAFGDVVFVTTGLLMLSVGAGAMQAATARGVAATPEGDAGAVARAVVRRAGGTACLAGAVVSVLLAASARWATGVFHVSSLAPFYWLGALAPLHFLQGVQRGALQGSSRIARLTATFQAEMLARLGGSWVALALGLGPDGVCAALFGSVVASLIAGGRGPPRVSGALAARALAPAEPRFSSVLASALVAQLGAAAFTQADIFVVKSFATPEQAGAFAVVILLGRIVSFATQAAWVPLLPAVVARARDGHRTRGLLFAALGLVAAVGLPLVLAGFAAPAALIKVTFGAHHLAGAVFLGPYLAATLLHACAFIVVDYAFCLGVRSVGYISLALGLTKLATTVAFAKSVSAVVGTSAAFALLLLLAAGGAMLLAECRPSSA
jgi:O-antigen/teichoic acid export membrane protein